MFLSLAYVKLVALSFDISRDSLLPQLACRHQVDIECVILVPIPSSESIHQTYPSTSSTSITSFPPISMPISTIPNASHPVPERRTPLRKRYGSYAHPSYNEGVNGYRHRRMGPHHCHSFGTLIRCIHLSAHLSIHLSFDYPLRPTRSRITIILGD
jgi:hypothetical protein